MVRELSKEEACTHFAYIACPQMPIFQFRKIIHIGGASTLQTYQYNLNKYKLFPPEINDPPDFYFLTKYFFTRNPADHSVEHLSIEEYNLLRKILGIKDLGLILDNPGKFDDALNMFYSSDEKPSWDLIIVLSADAYTNYKTRQRIYEDLMKGGINLKIKAKELTESVENRYVLPKRNHRPIQKPEVAYFMHITDNSPIDIGTQLAEYWGNLPENKEHISRLEKVRYALRINECIDDALKREELPIRSLSGHKYQYPSNSFQNRPLDSVLFWHEIRHILIENEFFGVPEEPIFMDSFKRAYKDVPQSSAKEAQKIKTDRNSNKSENKKSRTYTLLQLKLRWQRFQCSLDNILDFANEGHFGIYVKPLCNRASYWDVEKAINELANQPQKVQNMPEEQKQKFLEYPKKLKEFVERYPYLLQEKDGFERLATDVEVEIKGICQTGSIEMFRKKEKLKFLDFNNSFGFVESDLGECGLLLVDAESTKKNIYELPFECNSAYIFFSDGIFYINKIRGFFSKIEVDDQKLVELRQKILPQFIEKRLSPEDVFVIKSATGHSHMGIVTKSYRLYIDSSPYRAFPEDYKGYFSETDLHFFVDQIENFEATEEFQKWVDEIINPASKEKKSYTSLPHKSTKDKLYEELIEIILPILVEPEKSKQNQDKNIWRRIYNIKKDISLIENMHELNKNGTNTDRLRIEFVDADNTPQSIGFTRFRAHITEARKRKWPKNYN